MATVEYELQGGLRSSSVIIWLVGAAVLVFLGWAKFAPLDEIVRAEGEMVSAAKPQIIQNLEGGILSEMLVTEGDEVKEGDVLARLQGTAFQTSVADLADQLVAAEIRRLRLEAEMAGTPDFAIDPQIEAHSPDIAASERALLIARQADYSSKLSGAETVLNETRRELESMEDMFKREIVALFEVTRARKAFSEAQIKYDEVKTSAELDRASEYSETLQQLATLTQNLRMAKDQLSRTVITSPMNGIVNKVGVTTIGGVVRPGEEIFQIIPVDDELVVEAQVKPQDIAQVHPGQSATVKLTSYDYTIYGTFDAEVEIVSADTFKDERRPDLPAMYHVQLSIDLEHLTERQKDIAIRPGMQATVELNTGQKTVLQYLTKPLYRSSEALHER